MCECDFWVRHVAMPKCAFLLTVLEKFVLSSWMLAKMCRCICICICIRIRICVCACVSVSLCACGPRTQRWQWQVASKGAECGFRLCGSRRQLLAFGHPAPTRWTSLVAEPKNHGSGRRAEIMAAFATNRACKVMSWPGVESPSACVSICVWCNSCCLMPQKQMHSHLTRQTNWRLWRCLDSPHISDSPRNNFFQPPLILPFFPHKASKDGLKWHGKGGRCRQSAGGESGKWRGERRK